MTQSSTCPGSLVANVSMPLRGFRSSLAGERKQFGQAPRKRPGRRQALRSRAFSTVGGLIAAAGAA
jgi:hypothetical protein